MIGAIRTGFYKTIAGFLSLSLLIQPMLVGAEAVNPYFLQSSTFSGSVGTGHDISSTGAFTYSIDVVLPDGRNEQNPNLSIGYSSQGSDAHSIFGHGWSANIPYIERRNTNGVDVMYGRSDFFSSLSGNLSALSTSTNSGAGTYEAEISKGLVMSYEHSTDGSWEARDAHGNVYVFGETAMSRLDDPSDADRVWRWYVSEMRDRNGNTIVYDYTKTTSNVYPQRVTYSGHASTTGAYAVDFVSSSTQAVTGYTPGFEHSTDRVITQLNVSFDGNAIAEHIFDYSTSVDSSRQLLSGYTRRGFNGTSWDEAPTETFAYSQANVSFALDASIPAFPATHYNPDENDDYYSLTYDNLAHSAFPAGVIGVGVPPV